MPDKLIDTAHNHTVSSFDNQLANIIDKILQMGDLVAQMLNLSRKSLDNPSDEILATVRATDKKVNALDFELQTEATKIIALRQPMGVDLRFIISVLKIVSSLERMGDLVKSTCKKSAKFHTLVSAEILTDIKEMHALANRMLISVMNAFRDLSAEKANDVLEQDNEVDDIYHKLLKSVQVHIKDNPDAIPAFADIIFTAKNYERLGDHCTKIADLIHYISSGKMVAKQKKAEMFAKDKKESN